MHIIKLHVLIRQSFLQHHHALTERSDWSADWGLGREMWRCVGTKRGVEACVMFPGTTEMLKWSAISWDTLVKVCSLHSGQLIYIHVAVTCCMLRSIYFVLIFSVRCNSYMYWSVRGASVQATHTTTVTNTDSPLYRCCGHPRIVFWCSHGSNRCKPGGLQWQWEQPA